MKKELRKVLELDTSGESASIEEPPAVPPTPIPGSTPKSHLAVFGVNGSDKPILASLPESHRGDAKLRPIHGSSKVKGSTGDKGGNLLNASQDSLGPELGPPVLSQSPMSAHGRSLPSIKPRDGGPEDLPKSSSSKPDNAMNKR